MPAQLLALDEGPSILLDKPILLIGRHPECDIQIESRKISRRHCCIAQVSDYLVVRDLDSTNGIRINGTRVQEGRLAAGDELTLGNHRYKVVWEEAAPGAPVPVLGVVAGDEALESSDEPIPLAEPMVPAGLPAAAPNHKVVTALADDDSFVMDGGVEVLPDQGPRRP